MPDDRPPTTAEIDAALRVLAMPPQGTRTSEGMRLYQRTKLLDSLLPRALRALLAAREADNPHVWKQSVTVPGYEQRINEQGYLETRPCEKEAPCPKK